MQKKLISLAIAGALAVPGAAMADVTTDAFEREDGRKEKSNVTIYGKLHASWDYLDHDTDTTEIAAGGTPGSGSGDDTDDNTAVFRNSRLGFKGEENLGYGGLKGIWQVETHVNTGQSNVGLRNTFVGLSHNTWGTIKLGRHDTPYKSSTAKLDIFSDTIADYNNLMGVHMVPALTYGNVGATSTNTQGTAANTNKMQVSAATDKAGNYISLPAMNFNERENNLLMYITPPNRYGIEGRLARESFSIDEENTFVDGAANTTGWDDEYETWSLSGTYDKGPLYLAAAYELFRGHNNHNAAGDNDIYAWKIGFGYELGNSKLGFVYEDINHDGNDDQLAFDANNDGVGDFAYGTMSRDAFTVNFAHQFGRNVVKLAYGKADDSDLSDADDGADSWAAGIEHLFSKRTKVYAIYTLMDNDQNGNYGLYAPGNTAATVTSPSQGSGTNNFYTGGNGDGDDISAFSVGIIHNF
jgi:predicted porin